jgi:hypothetical protein
LPDLKLLFPSLPVLHLMVDTSSDKTAEWFVMRKERRA